MKSQELQRRTKAFALQGIRFIETLPATKTSDVMSRQLLRSGTSVGANYRAACRAKSRADFIAKMSVVEEEADGCAYWLELLEETGVVKPLSSKALTQEAHEITAMTVASIKSARKSSQSLHSAFRIPHSTFTDWASR